MGTDCKIMLPANVRIRDVGEMLGILSGLKAEKQYENIIKYTDSTKALLVLDGEIEKDITLYNSTQELLAKWQSLNQEYGDTGIELKDLEIEFSELMPNVCPLCEQEIKCR